MTEANFKVPERAKASIAVSKDVSLSLKDKTLAELDAMVLKAARENKDLEQLLRMIIYNQFAG